LRRSRKNFSLKVSSWKNVGKILIGNAAVGKSRKNFDRKVRSCAEVGKILIGNSDRVKILIGKSDLAQI